MAKHSRTRDRSLYGKPGKLPGIIGALLLGAALFGAPAWLRGQDFALPTGTDSSHLELRPNPTSTFQPSTQDTVISADDLLDIYVFDVAEISRQYRVSPSGSITLPLLSGPIAAAGLTPDQLSLAISDKLRTAGLVSNPQVTVAVKESRIQSVAVAGAVKRPQIYPIFGRTTLLDVLSQAEGLADDAGNIAIIRRGEVAMRVLGLQSGQDKADSSPALFTTASVDLKRLLETGEPGLNLDLYPGDRVTVQRAGIIYVVGAVNRSGGFTLKDDREEMTVLKAIALAEDLKSTAVRNKAMIIRKNPQVSGQREEIPVNLKEVLAGHASDRPMQANDILFVPDSSGKKAMRRAAEAALQITTGIIIWRR
jgi:polysaccharide export outer membrane protein